MIKIKDLKKTYSGNVQALRGVDLEIETGMFGLLGPNGAGKTTLMRILAGLLEPSSGQVIAFGNDIATAKGKQALKMTLGYLPQELGLYPELSASEFLDYMAILKGISDGKTRKRQISELLAMVALADTGKRRLKTFSGGMKRRVGIAQALLGHPKLIIVDEPTAGLDPEERIRFRNLLTETARRCTVILSTHIVEDISQSCKDLAVLNKGKVLFQGSPSDLIAQAQGYVWHIITDGPPPDPNLAVISTLQVQEGMQYRVVGKVEAGANAKAVTPSLEDGYMCLMKEVY